MSIEHEPCRRRLADTRIAKFHKKCKIGPICTQLYAHMPVLCCQKSSNMKLPFLLLAVTLVRAQQPCMCPFMYDPVCGIDRVTYRSDKSRPRIYELTNRIVDSIDTVHANKPVRMVVRIVLHAWIYKQLLYRSVSDWEHYIHAKHLSCMIQMTD